MKCGKKLLKTTYVDKRWLQVAIIGYLKGIKLEYLIKESCDVSKQEGSLVNTVT